MNIIIHYPSSEESKQKLREKVAVTYANAVFEKVNQLNCPKEQKIELINSFKK